MNERNAYEVLGLEPGATDEDIRGAYRARSLLFHPDRLAGVPEGARAVALVEMKAINRAYALLKDPLKRAALDSRLDAGAGRLAHTRPSPAVDVEHTVAHVRVEVTAGAARGAPYAHAAPIFPPHTPPPKARVVWCPPTLDDLGEDAVRVVFFGLLTAPGWAAALAVTLLLPALCGWVFALGFGLGLAVALPWIKPAAKRRPSSAMGRAGFAALILAALGAVLLLLGLFGSYLPGVVLLTALFLAMVAHWGICLAGYFAL